MLMQSIPFTIRVPNLGWGFCMSWDSLTEAPVGLSQVLPQHDPLEITEVASR